MSLRLLYLIFRQVLGLVLVMSRMSSSKDVELLVLRHEVAVLRRTSPRPRLDWSCDVSELLIPEPEKVAGPTDEKSDRPVAASAGAAVVPKRRDGRSLPPA